MTGGLLRGTPGDNIGLTPAGFIGSTSGGPFEVNAETLLTETVPSAREQIEGHLSALKSLLKEHNGREKVCPIRLTFDDDEDRMGRRMTVTGKESVLVRGKLRGVAHASVVSYVPTNLRWECEGLVREPPARKHRRMGGTQLQFTTRFSTRRSCFKDPTKITKIMRRANKTLVAFKERWIVKTGFITGFSEVIKISSFMDAHKCPKLAKRYSDKVPKTVDEIMTRLDDFVRSEEAFASTELPKGEVVDRRRNEGRSVFNNRDGFVPYRTQAPYQALRDQGFHHPRFNLSSLTKLPKEILALEPQLNLQPPRPMQLPPPKKENQDKTVMINFTVVRAISPYNVIFGRIGLRSVRAVSSTIHSMVKFLTPRGITTLVTRPAIISECRSLERKQRVEKEDNQNANQEKKAPKRVDLIEQTLVNPAYATWISNPILVKKSNEKWRMCMDFKNINSACPKDHYPLPVIDEKIESVVGFRYKCFLDAYKGYHQVQMAPDDEEKTAFYRNEGTYCYTKMTFGLKNAGATYQRLVDTDFQSQIGRNLEAYVDDMVIKIND
nr:reverse transcriptase domain-containing protein [Tanacetum cinerariifolium]